MGQNYTNSLFIASLKENHPDELRRLNLETTKNDIFMKKIDKETSTFDKTIADNIIKVCFDILEEHHGLTKYESIFKDYRLYKKLDQKDGETIIEYLRRWEEIIIKLKNNGITINDTLLAADFMDKSTLSQQEKSLVQTKVEWEKEGTHFEQVKKVIRAMKSVITTKNEPPKAVAEKEPNLTLYSENNRSRFDQHQRNRRSSSNRSQGHKYSGRSVSNHNPKHKNNERSFSNQKSTQQKINQLTKEITNMGNDKNADQTEYQRKIL